MTKIERLVAWYATEWLGEIDGIDRLHEPHPGASDLTGAPQWSSRFRQLITGSAWDTDEMGRYYRPLRCALDHLRQNTPETHRYLVAVRATGWDWERAAWSVGVHPDDAHRHALAALSALHRAYRSRAI